MWSLFLHIKYSSKYLKHIKYGTDVEEQIVQCNPGFKKNILGELLN